MTQKNNRNPVLLVHGLNDTGAVFGKMAPYLTNLGWYVYDLDLIPCNGDAKLDHLARQVAYYINNTFEAEQPIDIVGFSMGGIVSRYYIQRLGGINRVQRFITIASPHRGTFAAYASTRPGCVQMRPDSEFLLDLNRDVTMLKKLNFTSIWTPLDLMIVPANSSQLPVGKDVQVLAATHPLMLTDNRSLQTVAMALTEPIVREREHTDGEGSNSQQQVLKLPHGGQAREIASWRLFDLLGKKIW
ncbi:esterase/lipase family protein [Microseira wollei]|uniref:Lipase, class 2 n=1 Tax=Microseira wollei NIES-4236 TaxID=2530354 RepID=A0AAV3XT62_9CYAN|nr:alpha/beta fold hydrolase [Microseira wollei]GET44441.1 lipase, class 2 [Microseira wollei NIES-4236]